MKTTRLFWSIVRRCHAEKIAIGFVVSVFLGALVIMLREPGIDSYGEALWYTFVASTTIGFGDVVVTTALSKIITVYLTLYEMLLVAMLSGVIVSHYLEVIQRREKYTATVLMDKLEHLSELSPEEMREIEQRVRRLKTTM